MIKVVTGAALHLLIAMPMLQLEVYRLDMKMEGMVEAGDMVCKKDLEVGEI